MYSYLESEIMNIFFLSICPILCAQYHCDKHVVKMILESTQLLFTNFQLLIESSKQNVVDWRKDCEENGIPIYKLSFKNHPMSIWTRKKIHNYVWLLNMAIQLCKEYTFRYNKIHKCQIILLWLHTQFTSNQIPSKNMFESLHSPYKKDQNFGQTNLPERVTRVPLCMPEECKHNHLIRSYREYYIKHKASFAKWTKRDTPTWFSFEK